MSIRCSSLAPSSWPHEPCREFIIVQSSNPITYHTYLSAILAVALGALFAFVYTWYLENRKAKREVLLDFSSDLQRISELSEEYWLGDHSTPEKRERLSKVSHVLQAKLQSTTEYRPLIERLMKKRFDEFDELDAELFIAATGDPFQTPKMKYSPDKFKEISAYITKIELVLRDLRS